MRSLKRFPNALVIGLLVVLCSLGLVAETLLGDPDVESSVQRSDCTTLWRETRTLERFKLPSGSVVETAVTTVYTSKE